MSVRASAQEINDEAARWVARFDSQPFDGVTRRELDQWLAQGDRHRGALFRAFAVWQTLGDGGAVDQAIWDALEAEPPGNEADIQEDREERVEEAVPSDTRVARRQLLWAGGAIAAALVPFAIIPLFWKPPDGDSNRISTGLGETARVPLRDGSLVVVNTTSALEVEQSTKMRNVRLDKGEAWFQVAKDAHRPFVVSAGDVRVRAIGTAFSVRRRNGGADVQVTEGTVEVWVTGKMEKRVAVSAGERTFVSDTAGTQPLMKDVAGIERTLSWREGALKFQGDTIQEAVDEFNRYNTTKLEVDPALANEKIVGRFSMREPGAFANMVSVAFGARVERQGKRIRLAKD